MSFFRHPVVSAAWLLATLALPISSMAQEPTPVCPLILTDNTLLGTDIHCPGTALQFGGTESRGVTLDCAGHSISTTDGIAIVASGTSGITIKNCNITTGATFAHAILAENADDSTIENNVITTTGIGARGIELRGSSGNRLSGNMIITTGDDEANAIRIRSRSNHNQVIDNNLQAERSYPLDIESADKNRIRNNTLNSPIGYLSLHSLRLQAGGLSVDQFGNIWALENDLGSNNGIGTVTTLFAPDPSTGQPLWSASLRYLDSTDTIEFGIDALEVLDVPGVTSIMALPSCCQPSPMLYKIEIGQAEPFPLNIISGSGRMTGLESIDSLTLLASSDSGELLNIDLQSGDVTLIGLQATGWADLAVDPTDGKAYALSLRAYEASNSAHLYEINLSNGAILTEIGDTGAALLSNIDFAPDGTLYGNNGSLVIIDTYDASVTPVGGAGFGSDPGEPWPRKNQLEENLFATDHGSVSFTASITLPTTMDTDISGTRVEIGPNRVMIDSALLPFLDEPARITLENLSGTYRNLLVDAQNDGSFEPCEAPRCKFVSFLDARLVFDVNGFSSYSSEENTGPSLEYVAAVSRAQIRALLNEAVPAVAAKKLKAAQKDASKALKRVHKGKRRKALVALGKALADLVKANSRFAAAGGLADDLLVGVKTWAQGAIDKAVATGGLTSFVTAAEAQMATAQALLGEEKPEAAILAYGKAWRQALKGIRYLIGGRLEGLSGGRIVLQQNGGDDLELSANGGFSFGSLEKSGTEYRVTILSLPHSPHHDCKVKNGKGSITSSDITSVAVKCSPVPAFFAYVGSADADFVSSFGLNPGSGEPVEALPDVTTNHGASSVAVEPSGRFVYLANYLSSNDTINGFRIDADSGELTKTGKALSVGVPPHSIAVHPSGRFAYVTRLPVHEVMSLRIDSGNGRLTPTGYQQGSGIHPASLVVDPSGRFVYVVNSGDGNPSSQSVASFEIDPGDGTLSEIGPPVRAGIQPSSIAVHPTARFAYVANGESIANSEFRDVTIFSIDPGTGALTEVGSELIAGSGPGSIAIDPSGRFAYVVNQTSNDVTSLSIDPVTGALSEVGSEVAAGLLPTSIAIDHTGRFAYVTNADSNNVIVYSLHPETGELSETGAEITTGSRPLSIALSPPKRFAYVANGVSDDISIFAINPRNGKLSALGSTATGTGPLALTVTPGGRFAYAVNVLDNTLSAFSIHPQTGVLTEIAPPTATGLSPISVTVDPSGRFAYATNVISNDITSFSIDPKTGALSEIGAEVAAGDAPNSMAIEPTGRFAYVANVVSNDVTSFAIDPASGALTEVGSEVAAGTAPRAVEVHPSGRFAYVVNQASHDITSFSIDLASGALTEIGSEIGAGDTPKAMTIHPGGRFAYVTNEVSDDVTTFSIDPVSGALTRVGSEVAAGDGPRAISLDPTGRFAYVTNFESNDVTCFGIDPVSGTLTRLGEDIAAGTGPHSISIIGGSH